MANPAGLNYVKVVGLYQMFTADSASDLDDLPDFVNLEGDGIIKPNILEAKNLNAGLTSVYLPEDIIIDVVDGQLSRNGDPWVNVLAPSEGVSPTWFNYTIELYLRPVGSAEDVTYLKYGPYNFDPVPDPVTGVVDMATATPVAVAEGAPMVAGAPGAPGDMVLTAGPAPVTGTVNITAAMLPSTRLWSLTGNVTITLPVPDAARSGTITLVLLQDATGNRTITWPSEVLWPDGIELQPAPAANSLSVIHLLWTGREWLGLLGGRSFA
ncbi:hypothetical protein SEA_WOLLYPOG_88 [Arthrobacter phage Wollypog]|uniref:Uncharacterized protein n=1 Tax=Arthrobacter phage Wollypog TaxID=2790985 RepID=A0A7T3KCC0_9CAUD|nr:hypothetical protein PP291_gp88 [Arthrobacter phage Wollypog]QPX62637.1 hypothetical protein SEA_WOLLYPOG_88 [Arthrobacter phage Wollypog]